MSTPRWWRAQARLADACTRQALLQRLLAAEVLPHARRGTRSGTRVLMPYSHTRTGVLTRYSHAGYTHRFTRRVHTQGTHERRFSWLQLPCVYIYVCVCVSLHRQVYAAELATAQVRPPPAL